VPVEAAGRLALVREQAFAQGQVARSRVAAEAVAAVVARLARSQVAAAAVEWVLRARYRAAGVVRSHRRRLCR
jgi:hypothetical protein